MPIALACLISVHLTLVPDLKRHINTVTGISAEKRREQSAELMVRMAQEANLKRVLKQPDVAPVLERLQRKQEEQAAAAAENANANAEKSAS